MKRKTPESIYSCIDTNTHASTQSHRIHTCKHKKDKLLLRSKVVMYT